MEMKKCLLLFFLCFFSPFSWGKVQYEPLSSVERHEISSGVSVSLKNWQKNNLSKIFPVFFLKYVVYFPEVSAFFPKSYEKIFVPGFAVSTNLFRSQNKGKSYEICKMEEGTYPFTYRLGLKGKSAYLEFLQPFAEAGFARSACYSKNFSKFYKVKKKLSHYFAYGVLLSLKILDKTSVYSFDEDYGINDVGVKAECLHYYPKSEEDKSFNFCQFGLQISF